MTLRRALAVPAVLAAASLAASLTACLGAAPDGDDANGPGDGGAEELLVGTGKDQFEPLAEGDAVDLVHGPQGGWHIWGAIRLRGHALGEASVTYAVALESDPGHPLSSTEYRVTPVRHGANCDWSGLIGYVPDPAAAGGKRVVLSMRVVDPAGHELSAEQHVLVRPTP